MPVPKSHGPATRARDPRHTAAFDQTVPLYRWLSGLVWAFVFWHAGHYFAAKSPIWYRALVDWRWSIAHSDDQVLLYIITVIPEVSLAFFSYAVVLADRYRILPPIGFVLGVFLLGLPLLSALRGGVKTLATLVLVSAYQLWRMLPMKAKRRDVDHATQALIQTMPQDLVVQLRDGASDTFWLKTMVVSHAKTMKFRLETRVLDAMTDYFQQHAASSQAATDAVHAQEELRHISTAIVRKQQDEDMAHEAKLLEHEATKAALRGKLDDQKTGRLRQVFERAGLRRRIAAARSRPIDSDFEQHAREVIAENDDILVAQASIQKEVEARTDIPQSAKDAAIAWLKEITIEELRRRMEKAPPSP